MVGSRPVWTTQQDPALPSPTHREKKNSNFRKYCASYAELAVTVTSAHN